MSDIEKSTKRIQRLGQGLTVLFVMVMVAIALVSYRFAEIAAARDADARTAKIVACNDSNGVRQQIIDYIDQQVSRALLSYSTTIASPSSSPAQVAAAKTNRTSTLASQAEVHAGLKLKDCSAI